MYIVKKIFSKIIAMLRVADMREGVAKNQELM